MLKFNDIFLEIFHYKDSSPLPEYATDLLKDLKTIGTKHFGLNVKDIYETKKWIENKKLTDSEIEIHQGRIDAIFMNLSLLIYKIYFKYKKSFYNF